MNTIRNENDRAEGAFMRFYDWVNDKLYPILGPADLAPYEPVLEQVTTALCPLCHEPMAEHYFDRSARDVVLFCPRPEIERPDLNAPLDEWGRIRK
jgi:hypothetical protein